MMSRQSIFHQILQCVAIDTFSGLLENSFRRSLIPLTEVFLIWSAIHWTPAHQ